MLNSAMKPGLDADACWSAVVRRDTARDGEFVYAVLTTGVYCRPGCRSRTPNRRNVRFYRTAVEAAADGFRPCLRCQPAQSAQDDPESRRMRDLCAYIDQNAGEPLTLSQLAARAGLSPTHLQRRFKAIVGVSPHEYLESRRMGAFKALLREDAAGGVTGAIYEAGYGSSSRLYEKVDTRLGMTPMVYRGGGAGLEITYCTADTPLGLMMAGATDRGLCFVHFGDRAEALLEALVKEYPKARLTPMGMPPSPEFAAWMEALNRHLSEGAGACQNLPLHIRATAFQMKVWSYLRAVPAGEVRSYREVAEAVGDPKAARAVARACASNSVALAIPCHRVIRGTGEMGGFRWGESRKRPLIEIERRRKAGR